jgi:hypothetical protein
MYSSNSSDDLFQRISGDEAFDPRGNDDSTRRGDRWVPEQIRVISNFSEAGKDRRIRMNTGLRIDELELD